MLPRKQVYICGSLPFMEASIKILYKWEVPKELIHYESFSPVAIIGD
ncbi:flavohemoprotein [Bacillus thuringiensis]|uniref:Flavohemoprotein n=1 Tax=Bacillus thuringiensis TaxID=1428 RepID=A0A9X6QBB5_BACTU|nr:Flavohemoprotein [Bacillus thuringiensis serovar kurstaki str. HD73]EEM52775.1 Flavohemoprotein [Bacillus thuringiensis serovar kurstaki str. T03a001]KAB1355421.1 flavohemoprotein [Bacillus thuringiensis]KEH46473.1 Flavohemoprotein (Hemoglobin-like protein) (Flavohemoglobin) (Nitric oxide dioxygenase) [Bacillus thuringiensis serovar kurstaki str. HD-1]KLA30322.1 Flavohemoprotein (Hemoglobin-like protein) (Flavohemoglobin) (Nitric oxide dioxygenase) [Bacillus cereus]NVO46802.1 flavohemoprote